MTSPVEVARLFRFVREVSGQNDGPWVEAIQRVTGNRKGDAWCASFVSLCLALAHGGENPLPMTASCDALLVAARKAGWLTTKPLPTDVFLVMHTPTDAVHTGFVTHVSPLNVGTIEGNTNDSGGREGYGVFERTRLRTPKLLYIHIP